MHAPHPGVTHRVDHSPPVSVLTSRVGSAAPIANGLPPPMPIVQLRKPIHPGMSSFASSAPSGAASPLKSPSGRSSCKTSGRRDTYTRFTSDEEAMLMEGVRTFGVGNWKKILNSYQFHWKRTAVDLKDKYRNMTRAKLRKMNAAMSMNESDDSQQNQQHQARSPNGSLNVSPSTSSSTFKASSAPTSSDLKFLGTVGKDGTTGASSAVSWSEANAIPRPSAPSSSPGSGSA